MVWKMSIDLKRPLVSSMGQHDPLDGLVTYLELQTGAELAAVDRVGLATPIAETTRICQGSRLATDDPLGIGGLLDNATRLAQMVFGREVERHQLLLRILVEARVQPPRLLFAHRSSTVLPRNAWHFESWAWRSVFSDCSEFRPLRYRIADWPPS